MALRHGFRPVTVEVRGPLSDPVAATFAVLEDTAVIEMASAAGLALLGSGGPSPATATRATTYGVGQLILAALDLGVSKIVVGVGGSASTDGGSGALIALGAAVRDRWGAEVPQGGAGLAGARHLDLSGLDPRARHQAEILIACDVESPLTGPQGAAKMFSPQKGADPATVVELENALTNWAQCVRSEIGTDLSLRPGAGAAGGIAFGLAAVLGAQIAPGIDLLLDISRFDQAVTECDLVIVGEGSLDAQSLMGKGTNRSGPASLRPRRPQHRRGGPQPDHAGRGPTGGPGRRALSFGLRRRQAEHDPDRRRHRTACGRTDPGTTRWSRPSADLTREASGFHGMTFP